jgi:hypothetical protein
MSQPNRDISTKLSLASMPVSWWFAWAESPVNSQTVLSAAPPRPSCRLTLLPQRHTITCKHLHESVTGISIIIIAKKARFRGGSILGHLMRHDYQKAMTDYRPHSESKNARRLMRGRGLQYAQYAHLINELEADYE